MSIAIPASMPPIKASPPADRASPEVTRTAEQLAPVKADGPAEVRSGPRPDVESAKSKFEIPPGQILVIDPHAPPGEGRVTIEHQPALRPPGSLLDVKY